MHANVIPMHASRPAKAKGTGIATAIMARRYGLPDAKAESLAFEARAMVERGMTPGRVRSALLTRIRRMSDPVTA